MPKNITNIKVKRLKVKDLKKKLKEADDDSDVVLSFYMGKKGLHSVYLSEILTVLPYDSVTKEKLSENRICELSGFNHDDCTYIGDD